MAIQTLFSHNPAPGIVKEISAMCHSREGKIRKNENDIQYVHRHT